MNGKSPILEKKYKMSNNEIKTLLKSNPIRLVFKLFNLSIICNFGIAFYKNNFVSKKKYYQKILVKMTIKVISSKTECIIIFQNSQVLCISLPVSHC